MKKIVLAVFLISLLFGDVTDIINKIKAIESHKIACEKIQSYDIFIFSNPEYRYVETVNSGSKTAQVPIVLYAIFQNKADINGKWVKLGDIIDGFRVIFVSSDKVILLKDGKKIILKPQNNILKVKK